MVKQTARLDGDEMSRGGIMEITTEEAVAIQKAALVMLIQAPPETRLAHVGLPEKYTADHIRAVYQNLPEFDEESLRARDIITRAARLMAVNAMNALPGGGANTAPRCPKCGYVMCQQFDSQPVNAVADIAIPNGKYICYYCAAGAATPPTATAAEPLLRDPVKVDASKPSAPPALIVTRNGMPCADQAAALEEFKERCRASRDDKAAGCVHGVPICDDCQRSAATSGARDSK